MSKIQQNIRRELKAKFNGLSEDMQYLYLTILCIYCGARLTSRQLNRCIEHDIVPLCIKCDKGMKGEYRKCKVMMRQASLF